MSDHTPDPSTRRVVVTGLGAVTPLGLSVEAFWNALLRGESGARPIASFDASAFPTRFACEVQGFDPLVYFDRKQARHLDPFCHYAVAASDEALRDAALNPEAMEPGERERAGIIFGSGIGGFHTLQTQAREYFEHGARRISPFFIPMIIPNMAGGVLSIRYGFQGPNHAVVSACATGNHALAEGLSLIREGQADLILCGGSEASVSEMGIGGFNAMKALSTRNDSPETASRPFDVERDGFVLGDGAGALVLEEAGHALRRGARIYAELRAVGASADAYHMSAPHPEGRGIVLALGKALTEAGLAPETVDSINMHATSTPLGDESEAKAVRTFFGAHADRLTATSTKSMTGHLLGAAGAVEAIATVLSIVHGVVPPTINLTQQDPACDVNVAANEAVRRPVRVALNDAFGFGGHNTCAVFVAWE
ncbi:MAG: beta-ketoacyl-ACP synthase II [Acidobacteria bacterium]|nr:beta-ketoacyl-ACP synthase II [Acidobacteriota bacterium]